MKQREKEKKIENCKTLTEMVLETKTKNIDAAIKRIMELAEKSFTVLVLRDAKTIKTYNRSNIKII